MLFRSPICETRAGQACSKFSPFSPANQIFSKFPTTTQRAKRLTCAPFSATSKPGEVGGEGLCRGGWKTRGCFKDGRKESSSGPLDLGACLAPRYPGYAGGGRAHLTQVQGWGWGAGDTRLRKGRRLGRELGGLALAESHFPAPRPLLEGAGAQGPPAKVAA